VDGCRLVTASARSRPDLTCGITEAVPNVSCTWPPTRSAISVAPLGNRHTVLFGDLNATFYAVEAETGKLLWKKKVDDHEAALLTGAATVYDGIAYIPVASWEETRSLNPEYPCCTFRGSVVALRVSTGAHMKSTRNLRSHSGPATAVL